jgi:hypothetical protein
MRLVTPAPIGEYSEMASVDRAGSQNWADPASDAAGVIAEETLSILLAVDATTAAIDADARRRADAIRRASDETTAPALARLDAMSHDLEALASELDGKARARDARQGHGD